MHVQRDRRLPLAAGISKAIAESQAEDSRIH